MLSHPDDLKYVKSHEFVRVEGDIATIGVTAFAADQLGDVTFVELPKVGEKFKIEPVDILLNMLFHKLEQEKTEVEWSYVVMSGKSEDADLIVKGSNATFKDSLKQCQKNSSSPSVAKRVLADKSATNIDAVAATGSVTGSDTCFNCQKPIQANLGFCQNCGASRPS